MALTPEEIAELQQKAAEAEELKQQIAALSGKKGEILDEKKQLQQQLKELQDAEAARKTKELEEQQRYAELLEQTRKNNEELQKQLQEKDQAISAAQEQRVKDRVRSDFMAAVAADVFNPEHAWALFQSSAADRDGKTIVVYKGAEIAPSELPAKMRSDTNLAYLCRPVKKGGMGAPTGAPGGGGEPVSNPYIAGNVTAQIALQLENPDEAAKLQAEARAARAAGVK
jgi:alanyl-tRNA synthetase